MSETQLEQSQDEKFVLKKDWVLIILLAFIGFSTNHLVSYSRSLNIAWNFLLMSGLFIFFKKRPVIMVVAYILCGILPSRVYGGFVTDDIINTISLQAEALIFFAVLFAGYGKLLLKQSYKLNLPLLFFVILMMLSTGWTVSHLYYSRSFFGLCAAYLFLPLFISSERDVKVVIASYLIYLNIFCVNALLTFASNPFLRRGIVHLDPNYASLIVLIGISLVLVTLVQYGKVITKKIAIYLYATLFVSLLTLTFFASMTAFIVLGVLMNIFLLYNFKKLKFLYANTVVFISTFFALNHYGFLDTVITRYRTENLMEMSGRTENLRILLNSFANFDFFSKLVGSGYGTILTPRGSSAHNMYLSILLYFGIIGLAIYCVYLFNVFTKIKKYRYKPFLMLLSVLLIWGFSIEPHITPEGVIGFSLLTAIAALGSTCDLKNPQNLTGEKTNR